MSVQRRASPHPTRRPVLIASKTKNPRREAKGSYQGASTSPLIHRCCTTVRKNRNLFVLSNQLHRPSAQFQAADPKDYDKLIKELGLICFRARKPSSYRVDSQSNGRTWLS